MIFTTKNKELSILGSTLTEANGKLINFFEAFERGGINGQDGIIDTFFSNNKKSPLTPELLSNFEEFKNVFNNSPLSAEALAEQMDNVDQKIIDYAKTCKNGELTTEGFKTSVEGMSFSAKASQAILNGLATAGNMLAFALIGKGIELAAKAIDNWVHRVDNANEAMNDAVSEYESAKSELSSINSELETNSQRIDELLAKDKLTYTEKGELEELQKITKELLLQQDIEERRVDKTSKEAADKAVDAYEKQYSDYDISHENLNEKLDFQKTNRTFLLPEDENDVTGNIAAYLNATEALKNAQTEYDNAVENSEDTTWLEHDLQFSIDTVNDYREQLDNNISDLQEKKLALEDEYQKAIEKKEEGTSSLTTSEKDTIQTYETIADAIKMIYEYTDPNTWNSMEISNLFSTDGIEKTKEELIAMANAGTLSPETISNYANLNAALENSDLFLEDGQTAAEAFCNEITACASEAEQLTDTLPDNSSSFTDTLSGVQSLSEGFSQLSSIYDDISNKGDFDWSSILNSDSFKTTFGNIEDTTGSYRSAYDNFIKTISNSPDDISACQDAFSTLASSYLYNSDALNGLTEETKASTIAMLEQMGVANAKDIVDARLAARQEALKLGLDNLNLSSITAINTTYDNIAALVTEGEICGVTASALYQLVAQETIFSNSSLSTSQKIAELERLAEAFGIAADSAVSAAQISSMVSKSFTSADGYDLSQEEINEAILAVKSSRIQKQIQEKFGTISANYAPTLPDNSGSSNKNSSSSTGSGTSNTGSGDSSTPTEASQTFDWIETRLDVLAEKTSNLGDTFSNAYGIDAKNEAYLTYLSAIQEEIDANTTAIAYYEQRLNEIGLSYEWIAKIQSGAFDISTITDPALIDQIQQYQSFYEKIQGYQNTVQSLEQQRQKAQADHAKDVVDTYDQEIDAFQKIIDKQKTFVSLKELFGGSASKKDLETQQNAVSRQINRIEEQNRGLDQLIRTTTYGSEAWQIYHDKIEENKDSISDFTQSLAELAKEIANLPLDTLDAKLEKISQKKEKNDAKIANATSAKEQNKLINQQMRLTKKENKQTQKAAEKTKENLSLSIKNFSSAKQTDKKYVSADQQKKIDSYYKQIKTYTKSKKQIPPSLITKLSEEGHSYLAQACVNYNAALEANDTAQATAALTAETTKTKLAELAKEKFDNVQTEYERNQSQINHKADTVNTKMELASAKGYLESENWYEQLIAYEQQQQNSLQAEATALQNRLDKAMASGNIKKYSDEWWEMTEAIQSVNESLNQGELTLQEYQNQLEQIKANNFDFLQQQISRLTSESDFFIDLMADKDLTDDNGLTDYGTATLGLHYQNYDTYLAQAEKYGEEIARINGQLANDPYNTTLLSQLQEREDAQRDCILAAEEEKNAVIDLKKQGYDALANSLSDVISKYKESLRNAKDARDYQKNIAKQSENINSLQRKITAYTTLSGNEEIAAKLQQANKELAEAQENLEETMYDKYISDTEDILDNLLDELEAYIEELISSVDSEFTATRETVNQNADEIKGTLDNLSASYGISLSSAVKEIWKDGYTPKQGFTSILDKMDKLITASNEQADRQADALVYEDIKDSYNKNLSDYENNVANAQARLENAKNNQSAAKEKYEAAKAERNSLKEKRDKIAKKYGTNSDKYKKANEAYLSAKEQTSTLKAALDNAKTNKANAQSTYDTAVKERDSVLSANRAVVLDFLKKIVNTSPTKSQEETTALDNAVHQLTGGYITDYNVQQLADLLGTGANSDEILAMLEKLGFAFITDVTPVSNMKYAKAPQESPSMQNAALISATKSDQTSDTSRHDKIVPSLAIPEFSFAALEENLPPMSQLFNTSPTASLNKTFESSISRETVSVDLGGITMYGVNDPESFGKQLREEICKNGRTTKCLTEAVASKITNRGIGTANLYR